MVTHLEHPCQRGAANALHCQVHMLKLHPRQLTNCSFSGGMRQLADQRCQHRCYTWGAISAAAGAALPLMSAVITKLDDGQS